jgi:hypothetical protein
MSEYRMVVYVEPLATSRAAPGRGAPSVPADSDFSAAVERRLAEARAETERRDRQEREKAKAEAERKSQEEQARRKAEEMRQAQERRARLNDSLANVLAELGYTVLRDSGGMVGEKPTGEKVWASIEKSGLVTYETEGFKGTSCHEAGKDIDARLASGHGFMVADEVSGLKAEALSAAGRNARLAAEAGGGA